MICVGDPEARVHSVGKQVLLDGRHFADAVSVEAAEVIVTTMLYSGVSRAKWPPADDRKVTEFFA